MGRANLLMPADEERAISDFLDEILPFLIPIETPDLLRSAWELASEINDRHTYDSVYLALARAFDTEFWTADRQLLRRLDGRIPQARFLGDYPLAPS